MLQRIYPDSDITSKVIDLQHHDHPSQAKAVSYLECFTSPKYRHASLLGCFLGAIQMLSGVNAIMFYSNILFQGLDTNTTTLTFLFSLTELLAALISFFVVARLGRKTIMVWGNLLMALSMVSIGLLYQHDQTLPMLLVTFFFIFSFSTSSGPVVYLYNAEILQDKVITIAVMIIGLMNIAISYLVPYVLTKIGFENLGYIFMFFGVVLFVGFVVMYFFMVETKGKSPKEIRALFCP